MIETVSRIPNEAFETVGREMIKSITELALPIINALPILKDEFLSTVVFPFTAGAGLAAWPRRINIPILQLGFEIAGATIAHSINKPNVETALIFAAIGNAVVIVGRGLLGDTDR